MGLFDWLKRKYRFPLPRKPEFYRTYIDDMKVKELDASMQAVLARLQEHKPRYQRVQENLHIPWQLVAAIHYGCDMADFRRDLETGMDLHRQGYKTWEESAIVSIGRVLEKFTGNYAIKGWSFEEMLALAEDYFEQGYYERGILAPEIWSGSNHYMKGVLTGSHFEQDDVYMRLGVAPLVQMLYVCDAEELERLV